MIRLNGRMTVRCAALFASALCAWAAPASAMVGGAPPATAQTGARHAVLIVGSRGNSCTGTAIARDLVLTAAHCVGPGATYKLVEFRGGQPPVLLDVAQVARHPQFSMQTFLAHRATADVALLKLASPLPARLSPAPLAREAAVRPGDTLMVAGYGVSVRGDGRSGGTLRAATLVATGQPGGLQIRLVDPAGRNQRPGLGACTGDSGAPAFLPRGDALAVVGVVSWSTAAGNAAGCGGLTGVTPLTRYRGWILDTARRLGSPVE